MNAGRTRIGHRTGFSLLETLLVLSVLGIALAIALPSYARYAGDQRARAAAHLLASDLRVAQQEALTRRSEVRVAFSSADPACGGHLASYVLGEPPAVIKRVCLPADAAWGDGPAQPLVFEPTGGATAGATLAVHSTRTGKRFTISVAAGTGAVTDAAR